MSKFILIGLLIAFLLFIILRKFQFIDQGKSNSSSQGKAGILYVTIPNNLLKSIIKKTLLTIGSGIVLLLLTLVLSIKFKIALIMLPISLYLIAQIIILNNHIKVTKSQRLTFDSRQNILTAEFLSGESVSLNLSAETLKIKEYKAVQRNNGILFGYYRLWDGRSQIIIPSIIGLNNDNRLLFERIVNRSREVETKLFPVI